MRARIAAWPVVLGLVVLSASCAQIFGVDAEYRLSGTGGAAAECGDGIVASGDACDDGNKADGDGCSSMCTVENGWSCDNSPSVCGCAKGYVKSGGTCIPEQVVEVVAGGWHTCARLNDGSVKCWGLNTFGQLGEGNIANLGDSPDHVANHLSALDLGTGNEVKALAAGANHTCALLDKGNIKCWGSNQSGELGQGDAKNRGDNPDEMGDYLGPISLGLGTQATSATTLAASSSVTCAVLDDGGVKCWGLNDSGQLGQGDKVNRGDGPDEMGANLDSVSLSMGATALALGYGHVCALLDDGTVKCWGHNGFGQLGLGNIEFRGNEPNEMGPNLPVVDLGTDKKVTALAAGYDHTCALLEDGAVKCWGLNGFGQLGLGDSASRGDEPNEMGQNLPLVDLGTGKTATALAAGHEHTCALLDDGAVKCWGRNDYGQLGLGDPESRGDNLNEMGQNLPVVDLGLGKTAKALSAGGYHTCALLNDSSIKCWGSNGSGQLGQGDVENRGDAANEMGDHLRPVELW